MFVIGYFFELFKVRCNVESLKFLKNWFKKRIFKIFMIVVVDWVKKSIGVCSRNEERCIFKKVGSRKEK